MVRTRDDKFILRTLPDGRRQASWRIWVLIWVAPALFAVAAAGLALQTLYLQSTMVETKGTVVRVYAWDSANPFDEGSKVYGPVFRYSWTDGSETDATAGTSSSLWNFPIGAELPIRYHPDTKDDIVVIGPTEWLMARVIAILAIATAIPALIGAFAVRRWLHGGAWLGKAEGTR